MTFCYSAIRLIACLLSARIDWNCSFLGEAGIVGVFLP
jgi:hypothetical protein